MRLPVHPHPPGMAEVHPETSENTVLSPQMSGERQSSGSWLVFPTFRDTDSDVTALLGHGLPFLFPLPRMLSSWTHVSLSPTEAGRPRQGGSERAARRELGRGSREGELCFRFPFVVIVKSGSRGHHVRNLGLTHLRKLWESPGRQHALCLGDLHSSESHSLTVTKEAPSHPPRSWTLPDQTIPDAPKMKG